MLRDNLIDFLVIHNRYPNLIFPKSLAELQAAARV